jgi:hypothetical protein
LDLHRAHLRGRLTRCRRRIRRSFHALIHTTLSSSIGSPSRPPPWSPHSLSPTHSSLVPRAHPHHSIFRCARATRQQGRRVLRAQGALKTKALTLTFYNVAPDGDSCYDVAPDAVPSTPKLVSLGKNLPAATLRRPGCHSTTTTIAIDPGALSTLRERHSINAVAVEGPVARVDDPRLHAAPDAFTTAPARALARPSSARQSPDSAAGYMTACAPPPSRPAAASTSTARDPLALPDDAPTSRLEETRAPKPLARSTASASTFSTS